MHILFIKHFFVGFMISEITRMSVFGNFPYISLNTLFMLNLNCSIVKM